MKKKTKVILGLTITGFVLGSTIAGVTAFKQFMHIATGANDNSLIQQVSKPLKEVKALNMDKGKIDNDTVEAFNKLIKDFNEKLSNEKIYLQALSGDNQNLINSSKEQYINSLSEFIDSNCLKEIKEKNNGEILFNVLKEIHSQNNRHIYSTNLITLGRTQMNENDVYIATVEINAVDDNIGFHVQRLVLYINDSKKIVKIDTEGKLHEQANTTTALTKDSMVTSSVTEEFQKELKVLINSMMNKSMYEKVVRGAISGGASEWKSFISKINVKEKDYTALYNMFIRGKADFKSFGIVAYEHSDIDAEPITTFTVKVADEELVSIFNIEFRRTTNKIVKITQIEQLR